MKKILIYITSLLRGGAERVTIYLARYFSGQGYDCLIVTSQKKENEYELPDNIKRISMTSPKKKILSHLNEMRRIFKNYSPDVILIMGVPECIFGIPAATHLNARIIVSERNSPAHFSGKKITKVISRALMKKANEFVFQTEDAKNYYAKKLKNRGIVIPNPLFTDNLPQVYCGERLKEIVAVGRLHPQKNHKLLIKSFSMIANDFPDYILKIYGEGILKDELQKYIDELGCSEQIILMGNHEDVLEKIKKAALFVLPSDYEGMPNALVEAMALGLPCISTDCPCGGPKELIISGENGVLVPVNDVNKLAEEMSRLLSDKQLSEKLMTNAMKIREKLDFEKIGELWRHTLLE